MLSSKASARYTFVQEFDAPRDFVFRWCTDYSGDDGALSREGYDRWVLSRSKHEVVFEDLGRSPGGWQWRRYTVKLRPPRRWEALSVGNYRCWKLSYHLEELPGGRTRMTLKGTRTPGPVGAPNPSKRAMEADLRKLWGNFSRALEREYRGGQRRGPRPGARSARPSSRRHGRN